MAATGCATCGPTYRPANRRELVNVSGWDTSGRSPGPAASRADSRATIGVGVRARLPFHPR
jgi:hypothetical protein